MRAVLTGMLGMIKVWCCEHTQETGTRRLGDAYSAARLRTRSDDLHPARFDHNGGGVRCTVFIMGALQLSTKVRCSWVDSIELIKDPGSCRLDSGA